MRKVLQYVLPVALTLFMCVTVERTVVTDGGYDRLYGLPLPYRSSNVACTGCYEVYVFALAADLLFYFAIVWGLFKLIERDGIKLRTPVFLVVTGVLVSLFWMWTFRLITSDSFFLLMNHTKYKTNRWELILGVR